MAICSVYIKSSAVVEGRVGWGAIIKTPRGEVWDIAGMVPADDEMTTSRSTLLGIATALETLPKAATVEVFTDVKYVAEGFRDSLGQWASKNWKRKANQSIAHADLWQRIMLQRERHRLSFFWTKLEAEHRRLAALAKRGRAGESVDMRHPALANAEPPERSPALVEHDELQRNFQYYLKQAAAGYEAVVTVDGLPVAVLVPFLAPALRRGKDGEVE